MDFQGKTKNRFFNKKRLKWLEKNYDVIANTISSFLSIGISVGVSFFYDYITKGTDSRNSKIFITISLIVISILLIAGTSLLCKKIKNAILKDYKYDTYVQKAYMVIQQLSLKSQAALQEIGDAKFGEEEMTLWIMKSIQLTIDECYNFFCASFDSGINLIDEVKFEVTFMTLSYEDSKITIPFSCNKEHRRPRSMLMRKNGEKDIYDKTITADIYHEYEKNKNPLIKIIENTSQDNSYKFLYNKQEDRIKSSIVLPVLSHNSKLLGTVVVHCNSGGFFKKDKQDFWYEIMQLFASEIGKYKLILDYICKRDGKAPF